MSNEVVMLMLACGHAIVRFNPEWREYECDKCGLLSAIRYGLAEDLPPYPGRDIGPKASN